VNAEYLLFGYRLHQRRGTLRSWNEGFYKVDDCFGEKHES
jgi:hypothetical protein